MINIACQFLELLIIIVAVTLVVKMFINAEQVTHFSRDIEYRTKLICLSLFGQMQLHYLKCLQCC